MEEKEEKSNDGHPKFTNLKPDFLETLDFIFYDTQKCSVEKILEIDEEMYLSENKGLPNSFHGSDHIPLMAYFNIN